MRVEPSDLSDPRARDVLHAYWEEIIRRYWGRPATAEDFEAAYTEFPTDDLALFLLAAEEDDVLGCAGLRVLDAGVGEITRVYVVPAARGTGVADRLMGELEARARGLGLRELRLDVRSDLMEAQRLYARLGYVETEPHNESPYAGHWFRKAL